MFHNYFFLKRLSYTLNDKLTGLSMLTCYSQNKDELIFGFGNAQQEQYLRASLDPSVCLIDFPEDVSKARKNYAALYEEVLDLKILKVETFQYERSFQILLEKDYAFVFKMHGSRSNILFTQNNQVVSVFKSQLATDETLDISSLAKYINPNQELFNNAGGDPKKFLPALGKEVNEYLRNQGYFEQSLEEQWNLMKNVLTQLEQNPIFIYDADKPILSLLNLNEKKILETADPILGANDFRKLFVYQYFNQNNKKRELRLIDEKIARINNYLKKTALKKQEILTRRNYSEIANLIMANLYVIEKGSTKVTLQDFYTGNSIDIALKANLTPQKNAENYYRKAKNQQLEISQLEKNISNKQAELKTLEKTRIEIDQTEDSRALKKLIGKPKKAVEVSTPYLDYQFEGYHIFIGKNAKSNDELTLKIAKKDDLWLHAKDVAGSHVVVKYQSGKNFPKNVIERAAEIAAWYSKRKTDSLCPVIYTPKKFIRKRKGDPAGAVVVEKEEVIMVEPRRI